MTEAVLALSLRTLRDVDQILSLHDIRIDGERADLIAKLRVFVADNAAVGRQAVLHDLKLLLSVQVGHGVKRRDPRSACDMILESLFKVNICNVITSAHQHIFVRKAL